MSCQENKKITMKESKRNKSNELERSTERPHVDAPLQWPLRHLPRGVANLNEASKCTTMTSQRIPHVVSSKQCEALQVVQTLNTWCSEQLPFGLFKFRRLKSPAQILPMADSDMHYFSKKGAQECIKSLKGVISMFVLWPIGNHIQERRSKRGTNLLHWSAFGPGGMKEVWFSTQRSDRKSENATIIAPILRQSCANV